MNWMQTASPWMWHESNGWYLAHVFNRTLSNSHFYGFLNHIHAAKMLMTQNIARPLKAFHMSQVMVFLVSLYTDRCLHGVTCITASLLKSCWKKEHFLMGTRLVCNTLPFPFMSCQVRKGKRGREKEEVLPVPNWTLLSLIRSVSGSSDGLICSNKANNIEEASAKLQLVVNWLSSASSASRSRVCCHLKLRLKGSHCACYPLAQINK